MNVSIGLRLGIVRVEAGVGVSISLFLASAPKTAQASTPPNPNCAKAQHQFQPTAPPQSQTPNQNLSYAKNESILGGWIVHLTPLDGREINYQQNQMPTLSPTLVGLCLKKKTTPLNYCRRKTKIYLGLKFCLHV